MNKQQLATKIWESANKMRSKIEANEYKDYILGFIFFKYLSDNEVRFLKAQGYDDESLQTVVESDAETVEFVQNNIGYFIDYNNLFSTWLKKGSDFDILNVTDSLNAFNRLVSKSHTKVFKDIFVTLNTGLSKLGETSGARTKAIKDLLGLIKDIPMDGKQDYDVLGFIYENLISNFAANAGKKAGEFYTPHEVSLLMSEIVAEHLKSNTEIKIYDPTSGSGSLLINIGKSVSKYINDSDKIKYYAQELKENTYNLTRMNLVMRGIKPDNIITRNADTLENDWPLFDDTNPQETYEHLLVDAVVSNPPYSLEWNPTNKESDPRYSGFGLAPKTKADFAFLLHDLYHVKNDGIMTIVLPHGVLFRGGEEGTIRKNLIEKGHVDAIIGLPANIFYGTGIPTIIMVLRQIRENSDTLIIDASKGFVKDGKNNKLRASDIKRIVDTVSKRISIPKYSKVITKQEIRDNDYNLNIPRYVDSSENAEDWDIYASMFGGIPETELNLLNEYWNAFPSLKNDLFKNPQAQYYELKSSDVKQTILKNADVLQFDQNYKNTFADFDESLFNELIKNVENLQVSRQESNLSDNIFTRLEKIPLIDKYQAYQLLDDHWQEISSDLEIIQTEGIDACKKVDPNLVIKKKDGKDQEVQEGWKGHIIPFDLIQKTILKDDFDALKEKESRLEEILSEYTEIVVNLTEEQKESLNNELNDDNTAFVIKEVTKKIKILQKEIAVIANDSEAIQQKEILEILQKVEKINTEEKSLKKQVKEDTALLLAKTITTIENLSYEQINDLLKIKWILPLEKDLHSLPQTVINSFITKLESLCQKYSDTLLDTQTQIDKIQKEVCGLLDELKGNEFDVKGLQEFITLLGGK